MPGPRVPIFHEATGSYTAMSKGVAACPAGTEIQSQAECKEALGALGLCHDSAWTGSITLIPAYCSHRPDHCGLHDWHFNSQTTGNSGRSDTAPICKADIHAVWLRNAQSGRCVHVNGGQEAQNNDALVFYDGCGGAQHLFEEEPEDT